MLKGLRSWFQGPSLSPNPNPYDPPGLDLTKPLERKPEIIIPRGYPPLEGYRESHREQLRQIITRQSDSKYVQVVPVRNWWQRSAAIQGLIRKAIQQDTKDAVIVVTGGNDVFPVEGETYGLLRILAMRRPIRAMLMDATQESRWVEALNGLPQTSIKQFSIDIPFNHIMLAPPDASLTSHEWTSKGPPYDPDLEVGCSLRFQDPLYTGDYLNVVEKLMQKDVSTVPEAQR